MIRFSAHTDAGPRRSHNEDAVVIDADLGLFVVLDGHGGTSVDPAVINVPGVVVPAALRRRRHERGALDDHDLRAAVVEANVEMNHIQSTVPIARGNGACIVALLAADDDNCGYVAWCGDCMAYAVRDSTAGLVPLFETHNLVNEQLKLGAITPAEARASRFKNIITRCLGFNDDVVIDAMQLSMAPGTRVVLASDGLAKWAQPGGGDTDDVEGALAVLYPIALGPIETAARALVDAACVRGTTDNVTAIVVERSAEQSR